MLDMDDAFTPLNEEGHGRGLWERVMGEKVMGRKSWEESQGSMVKLSIMSEKAILLVEYGKRHESS